MVNDAMFQTGIEAGLLLTSLLVNYVTVNQYNKFIGALIFLIISLAGALLSTDTNIQAFALIMTLTTFINFIYKAMPEK